MTVFAYGPGVVGIFGVAGGAVWFVNRVLENPYSTDGVGPVIVVFLAILVASLSSLLIGSLLIGGSHA